MSIHEEHSIATSCCSNFTKMARQVLGPEAGGTGVSIEESRGYSHVGSPGESRKFKART